jgi:hypothetical protein
MDQLKKTVVIGASDNPERYGYKATVQLNYHNHSVIPIGLREGTISSIKIQKGHPEIKGSAHETEVKVR